MTNKFMVGATLLCAALGGCQTSAPRTSTPAFTQRPGSTSPPTVGGTAQSAQPLQSPSTPGMMTPGTMTAGANMPMNSPPQLSPAGNPSAIPTAAPTTYGSQSRSTAPFVPNSGPAPGYYPPSNPGTPAFGPSTGPAGFSNAPIAPPPMPGGPPLP